MSQFNSPDVYLYSSKSITSSHALTRFEKAYIQVFNQVEQQLNLTSSAQFNEDEDQCYRLVNALIQAMELPGHPVVIPYLDLADVVRAQRALSVLLESVNEHSKLFESRLGSIRISNGCRLFD